MEHFWYTLCNLLVETSLSPILDALNIIVQTCMGQVCTITKNGFVLIFIIDFLILRFLYLHVFVFLLFCKKRNHHLNAEAVLVRGSDQEIDVLAGEKTILALLQLSIKLLTNNIKTQLKHSCEFHNKTHNLIPSNPAPVIVSSKNVALKIGIIISTICSHWCPAIAFYTVSLVQQCLYSNQILFMFIVTQQFVFQDLPLGVTELVCPIV